MSKLWFLLRPDGSGEGEHTPYSLVGSFAGDVVRLPSELGGAVERVTSEVFQGCPSCGARSRRLLLESYAVTACVPCMRFYWSRREGA